MHHSNVRRHGARLRRTDALPQSLEREVMNKHKYPHEVKIELAGTPVVLRYRRARKRPVMYGDDDPLVEMRDIFCWIEDRRGKRLGALHFIEWHADPFVDDDDFLAEMDSYSIDSYVFAEIVLAGWAIVDVAQYGALIEFQVAWQAPDAPPGLWHRAAEYFIHRFYSRRRASVLLLKAFPLEYEGADTEKNGLEAGFASRSRAMQRLYSRCLSVSPFPGKPGKDGWMWRLLNDGAPKPRARRRR